MQNPRENVDSPSLSPLGHHRDKDKEQHHKEKKEVVTVNEMCASPQGPPLDYSFLGIIFSAWECTMMFVCVCICIYTTMAHYWHTRTTRDQSGRRVERSTSAIGLPETASWLSRRWKWTANSESNQGMGAIIFIFFIMQSEALQGACLQGVLALKHTTHTHRHAHTHVQARYCVFS